MRIFRKLMATGELFNTKVCTVLMSVCISIAVVILLLPYVTNELWWDDSLNSQLQASLHRFNLTLPEYTWLKIKAYIASGRFLLCFLYSDALFYIFHTVFSIRLVDMMMVVINVVLFARILYKLKVHINFIALFILLLFGLFRITPYYDPLASLAWLYPSLGILFCISILFLLKWQETGAVKFLGLSVAVGFFSVCCYEIGLFYFPLAFYLVLTNQNSTKLKLKNLLVVAIHCLLYLIIVAFIRLNHSSSYGGISFGKINNIPATYLKQLIAPLPGSYYLAIVSQQIDVGVLWHMVLDSSLSGILFWSCFIACIISLNSSKLKAIHIDARIYKLGLALFFLPSLLISFSERYQNEMYWGVGYLPIYFQYFGLAILFTILLVWLTKAHKFIVLFCSIICSVIIALFITFNWTLNVQVANAMNARWWSQPSLKAQVAREPWFFAKLHDGDVVEIDSISDSIDGALIYMLSGIRVNIPKERGIETVFLQPRFQKYLQPSSKPAYYLLHTVYNPEYEHYWELTPISK